LIDFVPHNLINFSIQADTRKIGMTKYKYRTAGVKQPHNTKIEFQTVLGSPSVTIRVARVLPITKKKTENRCFLVFLGQLRSFARQSSGSWEKAWPNRRGKIPRLLREELYIRVF